MDSMVTTLRHERPLRSTEVARVLGVTKRTLQNWLKAGAIAEPERNPLTGYRLWSASDVEAIRQTMRERKESAPRKEPAR